MPTGAEPATDSFDFNAIDVVRLDAWTGESAVSAPLGAGRDGWAVSQSTLPVGRALLPAAPPSPGDWQHPDIGWGVILPDADGLTLEERTQGTDAPEPIRALLADRPNSKVLRYRAGDPYQVLRDYVSGSDIRIATAPVGLQPGSLPGYLLVVGSPKAVPWTVQYQLNMVRNVGRLDLPPEGLSNYVAALIDGWSGAATNYSSPVIWAVDHGDVITPLMRDALAKPLFDAYVGDPDGDLAGTTFIDGSAVVATSDMLRDALKAKKPSIIVTTSHGQTGPLSSLEAMGRQLGFLVDGNHHAIEPDELLAHWQPDGAIWFAQACCSAGAESPSLYHGLFESTSDVGQVLDGVAKVGPLTAPFPQALLGAARPLRAFVGHVEPTFDWTLAFPKTRAQLTQWVRALMYNGLCRGLPIGLAMDTSQLYDAIGPLLLAHSEAAARRAEAANKEARSAALNVALYNKVSAYDRACTVLLGDPTVALPLPK
jgi:hypothetical protein